ncbi:MAG TPA: penicillin-binding protein 2 [Clostridia bacterium]|nr:penicillin-binding protein 2 [Clostridia bacterium]
MEENKELHLKLKVYFGVTVLIFLVLLARLFMLQVINAEAYQLKSDGNRIRMLSIPASRGEIMTADGKVLATSKPVYTISVSHLNDAALERQVAERLAELLDDPEITADSIIQKLNNHARRFESLEIYRLPWGEEAVTLITKLEERRSELPGLVIRAEPMRYYPEGTLAGHIIGYEGAISEKELELYQDYDYSLNDRIGKTGLERTYEIWEDDRQIIGGLRGQKGAQPVEVDARHRIVREFPVTLEPTQGHTLKLTIDYDLQKVLEESLEEVILQIQANKNPKSRAGAGVVIDVKTGAILAMASYPTMNPNDFVDGSYGQKRDYYNDQDLKPAFNRAIQAVYPPGSTFKPVTALALLESGKLTGGNLSVNCAGRYWKPPYIKCWQAHGRVDFDRAMAVSCNTFFQYAAELAGIDHIVRVGQALGLGSPTGLTDLPGEAKGVLPTPEWKKELNTVLINRKYDRLRENLAKKYEDLLQQAVTEEEKAALRAKQQQEERSLEARYRIDLNFETTWQPFDTYNTSIGQGSNSYTMLQLANYVATLVNGGYRYKPYLVDSIYDAEGNLVKQFEPELIMEVPMNKETLARTARAMLNTTAPGGTAYSLFRHFPEYIKVGAKTGTAETGLAGDGKNDFHGVFIAFAPVDDPQLAFAGIVEYGMSGSGSAGYVAKAVFEEYFGLNEKEEEFTLPPEFYVEIPAE